MSDRSQLRSWEGRPTEHWGSAWRVPHLLVLRETTSTNDVARHLAQDGAPAGTIILAEHQTAGRGRMRRSWSDAPGESLLVSCILRPRQGGANATSPGTAPLRVGLATACALRAATGIAALVKWPNDIVVDDGLKLAGILCEAVPGGEDIAIIAGIGINVRQQPGEWPPELGGRAVSVAQLRGPDAADRPAIMGCLAQALHPLFTAPAVPLSLLEQEAFAALDALAGRTVTVIDPDGVSGEAAGVDADGALLIATASGVRRVTAGTVRAVDTPIPTPDAP